MATSHDARRNDAPLDKAKIEEDLKNPHSLIYKAAAGVANATVYEDMVEKWNAFVQSLIAYVREQEGPNRDTSEDEQIIDYATEQLERSGSKIVNAVGAAILSPSIIHIISEINALKNQVNVISQRQLSNFINGLQRALQATPPTPKTAHIHAKLTAFQEKLANDPAAAQKFQAKRRQRYDEKVARHQKAIEMLLRHTTDPVQREAIQKGAEARLALDAAFDFDVDLMEESGTSNKDHKNIKPVEMNFLQELKDFGMKRALNQEYVSEESQVYKANQQILAQEKNLAQKMVEKGVPAAESQVKSLLKDATKNNIVPPPRPK